MRSCLTWTQKLISYTLLVLLLANRLSNAKEANHFSKDKELSLNDGYIILYESDNDIIGLSEGKVKPKSKALKKKEVEEKSLKLKTKYHLKSEKKLPELGGFVASNLTRQDLDDLKNELGVLLVEKDEMITIDQLESEVESYFDEEKKAVEWSWKNSLNNIFFRNGTTTGNTTTGNRTSIKNITMNTNNTVIREQSVHAAQHIGSQEFLSSQEIIPDNVQKVGWRNVESDSTIMSKRVFIVDSGVAELYEEFNIDTSLARNFVPNEDTQNWIDCNGHGTHIAGIIAARENGAGVVGVAAGAIIVPIRVLNCEGGAQMSQILAAIDYVRENAWAGDVVNLSLGSQTDNKILDIAVQNAAYSTGAHFVIAAGNSKMDAKEWSPARAQGDNIYTVCATQSDGNLETIASFSNYGTPPVDVCAPGKSIVSVSRTGKIMRKSGTSMAAPHVSASLLFGSLRTAGGIRRDGLYYPTLRSSR